MRVDPEVVAAKFRAEVAILRSQADSLRRRGCYLVREALPEIDVLVVPTRHLGFGVPKSPPGVEPRKFNIMRLPPRFTFAAPMAFCVRFYLDDYDLRAPSVTFRHPATWKPLPHEQIPRGILKVGGTDMLVVHPDHPLTGLPFFCARGVREYHEHPQHTGDEWLLYRRSINVYATLTTIVDCCCLNTAPIVVLNGDYVACEWVV